MSGIDFKAFDGAIDGIELMLDGVIVEKMQKVILVVDAALVLGTPVDTGRARGNWLPSIGSPDERVLDLNYDKTGMTSLNAAITKAASIKAGDSFWISNNLPYIDALENGHSQQAPNGFIQKGLQAARAVK